MHRLVKLQTGVRSIAWEPLPEPKEIVVTPEDLHHFYSNVLRQHLPTDPHPPPINFYQGDLLVTQRVVEVVMQPVQVNFFNNAIQIYQPPPRLQFVGPSTDEQMEMG